MNVGYIGYCNLIDESDYVVNFAAIYISVILLIHLVS